MGGRHVRGSSEGSLIKWADGLRLAPAALAEIAADYRRLAKEAEEKQPANEALRESLRAVARRLTAAAERSQAWYQTARNTMASDFAAWESPRDGSLHKESKADVQRANDGN